MTFEQPRISVNAAAHVTPGTASLNATQSAAVSGVFAGLKPLSRIDHPREMIGHDRRRSLVRPRPSAN